MNVFVSVGSTANPAQEAFVTAIEGRLRAEGFVPLTVGRTYFSADSPFIGVNALMDKCHGVVVIALERMHFAEGTERRGGPEERGVSNVKIATPWNHIEAAFAYSRRLPLLVIVEQGVRQDGLLEKGFDWYVITTNLQPASLASVEVNGVLSAWKQKILASPSKPSDNGDPAEMSVGRIVAALKPSQFWGLLTALAVLLSGAFALGGLLAPLLHH